MNNILDFIKRNALWLSIAGTAMIIFRPGPAELKTLLLVAIIESAAIALSGAALFAYTKIDFTKETASSNMGFIFLGVHISVGLIVLGVYLAQYGA